MVARHQHAGAAEPVGDVGQVVERQVARGDDEVDALGPGPAAQAGVLLVAHDQRVHHEAPAYGRQDGECARMRSVSPAKPEPGRIGPSNVARAFDEHARSYDRLVGANRGYHEHLRMTARRMGLRDRGAGLRLLDLGCGTGASTQALLDAAPKAEIIGVDASSEMLSIARAKTWPPGVSFVHASADDLASAGITGLYDGILAAYLLRNLSEPNAALRSFYALLKPGAPLAVHEYSVADSVRSKAIWSARLLERDHPDGQAPVRLRRSLQVPVAQRAGFRRRRGVHHPDARHGVRRREGADLPRLAAAHRAHVPRQARPRAGHAAAGPEPQEEGRAAGRLGRARRAWRRSA